jgi:hypothetical protein
MHARSLTIFLKTADATLVRREQAHTDNLKIFATPARLLQSESAHAAKELNA